MVRLTVIKAITNQDEPTGPPVTLAYGEDPIGFIRIQIETPHEATIARISVPDLLRFTRLVALDGRKV